MEKGNNALVVAATGAGKSVTMAELAKRHNGKVLCLVHRRTLVDQNKATFERVGSKARVDTIQTISRREIESYSLVIVDECHRLTPMDSSATYTQVLASKLLLNPDMKICGFTATPYRLGTGYIYGNSNSWFKRVCYEIGTRMLQGMGFLSPMRYKQAQSVDLSNVERNYGGDYKEGQLESELINPQHLESVKHAIPSDRKAVAIFCVTIMHCKHMAEATGGMAVHSHMPKSKRQGNLEHFKEHGGILCSVMSLTEGWDATICDCVIIARPTLSTALFVQMVGRSLRINEHKKDALIIDMVGCYNRHGSPYNPEVVVKAKGDAKENLRREEVCPECGFIAESDICPECGCNIKEVNALDGVEYLNKPVPLKEVELDKEFLLDHIEASWYTSKSGSLCIRITCFNYKHKQLATDYFNVESQKATPKRKLRKAVNVITGIDIGSDFDPDVAMKTLLENPTLQSELEIKKDGRFKNVVW